MGERSRLVFRVKDVHWQPFFLDHFLEVRQVKFLGFAEFDVNIYNRPRLCFFVKFVDFLKISVNIIVYRGIETSFKMSLHQRFYGVAIVAGNAALEIACTGNKGISDDVEFQFVKDFKYFRRIT